MATSVIVILTLALAGYFQGQAAWGKAVYYYDVDECRANCTHGSCENSAAEGPWRCHCASGYSADGGTCTDKDDCALDTHDCNANATCTNTDGSFMCTCNAGYSGDGVTCAAGDPVTMVTQTTTVTATPKPLSCYTCIATNKCDPCTEAQDAKTYEVEECSEDQVRCGAVVYEKYDKFHNMSRGCFPRQECQSDDMPYLCQTIAEGNITKCVSCCQDSGCNHQEREQLKNSGVHMVRGFTILIACLIMSKVSY
ncbi:uncharacterized protein [Amphiura filiformis]|uniref:uncharacterized protein n=1 Tax=Amphiura filiformis TaxID=82378 RepID=UPI003B218BBA